MRRSCFLLLLNRCPAARLSAPFVLMPRTQPQPDGPHDEKYLPEAVRWRVNDPGLLRQFTFARSPSLFLLLPALATVTRLLANL